MKLKKKLFIIVILVLLIVIGIFTFYKKKAATWQPVKQAPVISAVYGLGTVEANKVFNLATGLTSYIQQIYVDLGDHVHQNQPLVRYRDGQIIRSPFAGVVTDKMSNVDEIVTPQTNVLTVTDLSDLYLLVNLDQDSLLKLNQIKSVRINFEALPHQVFSGTVKAIYSHDNNFYVRIIPQQLPAKILPGMTADVALITNSQHNSILIPLAAIKQGKVMYKLGQQKTTVSVQIGVQQDGWGQLLSNNIPADAKVRVK